MSYVVTSDFGLTDIAERSIRLFDVFDFDGDLWVVCRDYSFLRDASRFIVGLPSFNELFAHNGARSTK